MVGRSLGRVGSGSGWEGVKWYCLHAAKGGIGRDVFARDILREGGQGGGRRAGACSTAPQVYRAPPRAPATKVRLGRVVFVRDIQRESVPDPRGGCKGGGAKEAVTPALGLPDPSLPPAVESWTQRFRNTCWPTPCGPWPDPAGFRTPPPLSSRLRAPRFSCRSRPGILPIAVTGLSPRLVRCMSVP